MNLRNVFAPRYIRLTHGVDEWASQIEEVIEACGKGKPFFVFGDIFENLERFIPVRERLLGSFPSAKEMVTTSDEVNFSDNLTTAMIESGSDIVVAMGGGKCLDMGKYAAFKANLPFVSSPTQTSHDGICSPRAVLKLNSAVYSLGARTPMAIVVDIDTIRLAPARTLRAGIGDLVSNVVAVKDWQLGRDEKEEEYDDLAALISTFAAESVYGAENPDIDDAAFLEKFVHGLIFSGMAMEIAGSSRPCSGAGHKISHALDKLGLTRDVLHGEQVALGVIVSSFLHGMDWERMRGFLGELKLPTRCRDLDISPGDFVRALETAATMRPERYTILEKLSLDGAGYRQRLSGTGVLD